MTNETDLGTDDPLNIRELIGVREAALGRAMDVAASLPRWSDSTPDQIINIAKMIEAYMLGEECEGPNEEATDEPAR